MLVGSGTGDAGGDDAVADGIKLFVGGFKQTLGGCLTVDGVDHHLLGGDGLDGFKPGSHIFLTRVIYAITPHKHRLDDKVSVKCLHPFDNLVDIIVAVGAVHLINIYRVDGVEFLNVVIHPHQGIVYGLTVYHRGIAQYGDLRLRTVLVAQADGVTDDLREMGVTGRFAVAGKGQHVGQLAVGDHLTEFLFESGGYLFACGHRQGGTVVFVEAALAVDTVEGAYLAVGRQQVDA